MSRPLEVWKSEVVHVSSRDRSLGTVTNFEYTLQRAIRQLDQDEFLQISIQNAQIPFSYYTVNSTNNVVTATSTGAGGSWTATLTPGNYTVAEFATELKTQFDTADGTNTYTIVWSALTNKYTLTASADAWSLTWASGTATAQELLGWSSDAASTASAIALVSDTQVNVAGEQAVYIHTRTMDTEVEDSSTGGSGSILSKIPVRVGAWDIIQYEAPSSVWKSQSHDLVHINLRLANRIGTPLDLNGLHWECSLMVEHVRFATLPHDALRSYEIMGTASRQNPLKRARHIF